MNLDDLIVRLNGLERRLSQEERREAPTQDGWIADSDPWVYVSATSFKIVGKNVISRFAVGSKLSCTNTGQKYAYAITAAMSGSDTLVTTVGNSLVSTAITVPHYSYASISQGFPGDFAYTVAWTAVGTAPAIGNGSLSGKFSIQGRTCTDHITFSAGSTTTYGSSLYYFSLPVTETGSAIGIGVLYDSSTFIEYGGAAWKTAGKKVYGVYQNTSVTTTVPFAWASGDNLVITISYPI